MRVRWVELKLVPQISIDDDSSYRFEPNNWRSLTSCVQSDEDFHLPATDEHALYFSLELNQKTSLEEHRPFSAQLLVSIAELVSRSQSPGVDAALVQWLWFECESPDPEL